MVSNMATVTINQKLGNRTSSICCRFLC